MPCHTGPRGEAPGAGQQAEGVKGKRGPYLSYGFCGRKEQSRIGEFKQVKDWLVCVTSLGSGLWGWCLLVWYLALV